ncbi:MAG: hypothetical protein DHS20C18_50850 [Saprospiraceae bacterium]|nr:MAG: hypothetical protein DHS20C18_50850 [Saprospiraceae bacterium]
MNTWDSFRSYTKLPKAIGILETLSFEFNTQVLDFLKEVNQASMLELAIHFGWEISILERRLEALCQTGVVLRNDRLDDTHFSLNHYRLLRIQTLSRKLISVPVNVSG